MHKSSALPTKKIALPTVSAGLGVPDAPQPRQRVVSVLTGFPHAKQGYMDMASLYHVSPHAGR